MGSIPIGEKGEVKVRGMEGKGRESERDGGEGKGKWVGNMSGEDSVRERERDRDRRDSVLDGGERTV